jgi:hypothetical protein
MRCDVEFVDEPIEVEFAHRPGPPVAFVWREERRPIARVLRMWHDISWGPMAYRPKRWWQRRHRTYYLVETAAGERFEIYHDRGRGLWILYRRVNDEPE